MGLYDKPPELFVPDLRKPAGAAVDAAGNVTCVTCGATLPLAKADVVGQGYRCASCSAKAELHALTTGDPGDAAANLSDDDRGALRSKGRLMMAGGVAMVLGGAVVVALGLGRLGGAILFGGLSSASVGVARIRAAG